MKRTFENQTTFSVIDIVANIAISIAFGIMASTLLVLFAIPPLYAILDELGLAAPVTEEE